MRGERSPIAWMLTAIGPGRKITGLESGVFTEQRVARALREHGRLSYRRARRLRMCWGKRWTGRSTIGHCPRIGWRHWIKRPGYCYPDCRCSRALLESNPDGTLYARHAWRSCHPVSHGNARSYVPAHKLLSSDEQATRQQRINRVQVVDVGGLCGPNRNIRQMGTTG